MLRSIPKARWILVGYYLCGQLNKRLKQYEISIPNFMIKINRVLIGMLCCTALVVSEVHYKNEISQAIIEAYHLISGIDNTSFPSNQSKALPAPLKTQVEFILQQQSQHITQAPIVEELDDAERLQKLDDALHQLEQAEDEYDRELAVMDLGELRGAAAKQGLLTALNDDSSLVVTQAIRQINNWQDPSARTDMLLAALASENPETVEQTLLTINVVSDKRLIARLKQLGKHNNGEIRDAAKLALNLAP